MVSLSTYPTHLPPSPYPRLAGSTIITSSSVHELLSPPFTDFHTVKDHLPTTLVSLFNFSHQALRLLTVYIVLPTLWMLGNAASASGTLLKRGWKSTEKFRDDCFVQVLIWLLNPYALALFVFWPGWWILGLGWWLWSSFG